jgi:ATP-binding cassette subfamily B protein
VISTALAYRCVSLSKGFSESVSSSTGKLIDAIANAETIRSFARGNYERLYVRRYFALEQARSMRLRSFLVIMRLFQGVTVLGMLAIMVYIAMADAAASRISIGSFTLVFTLSNLIGMNVWNLSNRMLDFFEQYGTLTEAIDLITGPHEIADPPEAPLLTVSAGAIEFRGVGFRHGDGHSLFEGLDLRIAAGEKVALVGPSGAGKTTLVKLLRRQYDLTDGQILIDGQDIATVSWESLNAAIAEVSQQPGIFHRPVGANIAYGRLDADEEDIAAVARQAACHEFIARRPLGYGTIVGEQGIKLSGGERQRIAIARAILKDARVLILDEATSALDSQSEHLIQQALWGLMQGRTVIAIAHRLSTVTAMDRILYLEDGRILEEGSHGDLVARRGAYAKLWDRQVGGFIGAA